MNKEFIELVINNGYEYRENKEEISIDKIYDELGNVDFFININKKTKEVTMYFDKDSEQKSSSNVVTLTQFDLDLLFKIKEGLSDNNAKAN